MESNHRRCPTTKWKRIGTPQKPRHPKSIETPSQATSLKRERFVPVFSTVSDGIGIYGVVASVPVTWPILRRGFLYVVADDASGGSVLRFPRTSAFIISFDHNAHRNVSLVDRAWRSDAPAAGCRTRLAPCNNINNGERERERIHTECGSRVHQRYHRRGVCTERRIGTCLVAILPRDRCTAIQVSFCFERTEKGVLRGRGEQVSTNSNNGETVILFW